jgi:hypothetical protein
MPEKRKLESIESEEDEEELDNLFLSAYTGKLQYDNEDGIDGNIEEVKIKVAKTKKSKEDGNSSNEESGSERIDETRGPRVSNKSSN